MKHLLIKLKESTISVAPIALTVLALGLAVGGFTGALIPQFVIGAVMLIVGLSLFSMGADVSMIETGNLIGSEITKSKKLWLQIIICFALGFIVTIAEPDLMVLGEQLASMVDSYVLILAIAAGVGVFMVIAMLRIIFKIRLKTLLVIFYAVIFLMALFIPEEYLPLSFDSAGVTTGPITVPFIMALGAGIAAARSDSDMDDSFGVVALCALGPIIATMILGFFADKSALSEIRFENVEAAEGIIAPYISGFPRYMFEVSIALLPIIAFIFIFNFIKLKLSGKSLAKIGVGFINVYIGLVLFLTGANIGFAPAGKIIGASIVAGKYSYALIPAGILMGFFTVIAEPAVYVLISQIEELSVGTIKKRNILVTLMIGAGIALGLSMVRILTGISIWWIIAPGYAAAIILTFFSSKVFTAIAFDSGCVATGPMTAAFILPFAIGASVAVGGNVLKDAFGVVALATITPVVAIQIMGIISDKKTKKRLQAVIPIPPEEVVDFDIKERNQQGSADANDDIVDFDEIVAAVAPQKNKNLADKKTKTIKSRVSKKRNKSGLPIGEKDER